MADGSDGKVTTYSVEPEDVGLSRATLADIRGGETVDLAAEQVRAVLRGEQGARLDMVLLNSGAALLAGGLTDNLQDGVQQAREIINSGAAYKKLEQLVSYEGSAA